MEREPLQDIFPLFFERSFASVLMSFKNISERIEIAVQILFPLTFHRLTDSFTLCPGFKDVSLF